MSSGGDDNMIATLDAIIDNAVAITTDASASSTIDERDVIHRLEAILRETTGRVEDMIDVLGRLEVSLQDRLKNVPEEIERAAFMHRAETLKWRPDPPAMPREITAFFVLQQLRAAHRRCIYEQAKARYEAIRKPGDRCDCAARIEAQFLYARPEAPLQLLDSSGVPYAAMDYLWLCEACGTKWFEDESHDDFGSHSRWRAAPSDAVSA